MGTASEANHLSQTVSKCGRHGDVGEVGNMGEVGELGMVGDEITLFLHLQAHEVSVTIVLSYPDSENWHVKIAR